MLRPAYGSSTVTKSKKTPSPQEIYKARKQREEDEKDAFLPPGLINHGNTCFMNSVLQGLAATRLLYDLAHFTPIPPNLVDATSTPPISPRRSPQLTNGHGFGGEEERAWVEGMPVGDVFLKMMLRAWDSQAERRRECMSPRELLSVIGKKYDQYLDFRQQDAHEFLRHLLDAMRMEELDIIKQRQPPPPKKSRRNRRDRSRKVVVASSSLPSVSSAQPTLSSTQPTLSSTQPSLSSTQPTSSSTQPSLSSTQPSSSTQPPQLPQAPLPLIPEPQRAASLPEPLRNPTSIPQTSTSLPLQAPPASDLLQPLAPTSISDPPHPPASISDPPLAPPSIPDLPPTSDAEEVPNLSGEQAPADSGGQASSSSLDPTPSASTEPPPTQHPQPTSQPVQNPSSPSLTQTSQPQPPPSVPLPLSSEPLASFPDMLFGGHLTSLLICEKCKHISSTYEPFNDLSLSLKPEDYVRGRKRERLKRLAKKFRIGGSSGKGEGKEKKGLVGLGISSSSTSGAGISSTSGAGISVGAGVSGTTLGRTATSTGGKPISIGPLPTRFGRSSSVPPSPSRISTDFVGEGEGDVPVNEGRRRRSVETGRLDGGGSDGEGAVEGGVGSAGEVGEASEEAREEEVEMKGGKGEVKEGAEDVGLEGRRGREREREVGFVDQAKPEKTKKEKEKLDVKGKDKEKLDVKGKDKDKEEDGWVKLGRRISTTMGLGKWDKDKRGRSKERGRRSVDAERSVEKVNEVDEKEGVGSVVSTSSVPPPLPTKDSIPGGQETAPPSSVAELAVRPRDFAPRVPSPLPVVASSADSTLSTAPSTSIPRIPMIKRASSPSVPGKPTKTPRPPKLTREESAYLRRILADIPLHNSSPFTLFRTPSFTGTNPTHSPTPLPTSNIAHSLWAKLGQITSVEECLRLFTAVEVLEGENMVGCRRCWKIANGKLSEVKRRSKDDEGEVGVDGLEEDSEDSDSGEPEPEPEETVGEVVGPSVPPSPVPSENLSDATSTISFGARSAPLPTESEKLEGSSSESQTPHFPSLPLDGRTTPFASSPELPIPSFGGLPIPVISTTEVDNASSPIPSESTKDSLASVVSPKLSQLERLRDSPAASSSKDSLQAPKVKYGQSSQRTGKKERESSSSSDDESSSGSDTDASGSTSFTDTSLVASPAASPSASQERIDGVPSSTSHTLVPDNSSSSSATSIPRSKQVILRRAYKRYLIATPPPVLVIHLKRFQQVSRNPMMSFSSGFKKLDDYVSFPEFLDLQPFLAPKKEDFGLGKKGKGGMIGKVDGKGKADGGRCMYRLYAVVVHIGNMLGGHYVAYTALPTDTPSTAKSTEASSASPVQPEAHSSEKAPRKWAYISDTVVRLTTLDEVLKARAYLCMYERI
ncbi:hypothetical protein JAAARDRAFT_32498 [Jaapia argillacea MUCL 33604]|uniref:ubiquitinyl hydrolase 1 n=1 Tax=Jaapia argillacea MUCL 33604 TaxID=933084 RepID=A0A067PZI9_9AGAM|nr:hypothetical protein JAAARDRAFT_32498 [Jaapia argillacea MUCL 33604]